MNLPPIPPSLVDTRDALHQLAYFVFAPARYRRTGRMGLVPTHEGFGTPDLGGRVLRVDGDLLVDEGTDQIATVTMSSIGEAARFFGEPYEVEWFEGFGDELPPWPPEEEVRLEAAASRFIGDLFGFGAQVIDAFAERVPGGITEVWIWPEHFDLATEAGDAASGGKASFGVSPGDHAHDEPYFYVSAWGEIDRRDRYWNDRAFNGASLAYLDVVSSDDPVAFVVDFMLDGNRRLNRS